MSIEEEFEAYKRLQTRRSRIQSLVLGGAAVITIVFMIYGFAQSIEASSQRALRDAEVRQLEHELSECQKNAKP